MSGMFDNQIDEVQDNSNLVKRETAANMPKEKDYKTTIAKSLGDGARKPPMKPRR